MGLFLSSSHFWFVGGSLFGAGNSPWNLSRVRLIAGISSSDTSTPFGYRFPLISQQTLMGVVRVTG
jgi:hypothetical protein